MHCTATAVSKIIARGRGMYPFSPELSSRLRRSHLQDSLGSNAGNQCSDVLRPPTTVEAASASSSARPLQAWYAGKALHWCNDDDDATLYLPALLRKRENYFLLLLFLRCLFGKAQWVRLSLAFVSAFSWPLLHPTDLEQERKLFKDTSKKFFPLSHFVP